MLPVGKLTIKPLPSERKVLMNKKLQIEAGRCPRMAGRLGTFIASF